jgi:rSAM/selenodomain-associated transferase 2
MAVSVIIPTLNEGTCIAQTVEAVRRQGPLEIIVVDGGSDDSTIAAAAGADRLLTAPAGRASQMNAGAARARGDCLLFLHADCTLAPRALAAAERALSRPSIVAGCFSMRVGAPGTLFRAIDGCATARVRWTGIVYGDQGLFVLRAAFQRAGGFPCVRFLEDVLLSRDLLRQGRIVVLPQRVFVSPRRWQRNGLIRQTLRNWSLIAQALWGTPLDRLAQHYPPVR